MKTLIDYFWESVDNGLKQRKLIREFIYSAEKSHVPLSWLHEHIPVFMEEDYFKSKQKHTQRYYQLSLRKWLRWVYEEEGLSIPECLRLQYELEEEKPENTMESEPKVEPYEYVVPVEEEPADKEYLEFLRKYEKIGGNNG